MTRSQSVPLNIDEEDSEAEELGIDWLWPSQISETVAPSSPPPKETDTGIFRMETPEFVSQSQPLESLEDPQTSLMARDSEAFHPSEVEEEGSVVQEAEPGLQQKAVAVHEEEVSRLQCLSSQSREKEYLFTKRLT